MLDLHGHTLKERVPRRRGAGGQSATLERLTVTMR
jgi:hypothetical protein